MRWRLPQQLGNGGVGSQDEVHAAHVGLSARRRRARRSARRALISISSGLNAGLGDLVGNGEKADEIGHFGAPCRGSALSFSDSTNKNRSQT